jgi:hypothetical protein
MYDIESQTIMTCHERAKLFSKPKTDFVSISLFRVMENE